MTSNNHTRKRIKLIYGVGVNDLDYMAQQTINGKKMQCKFYQVWKGMIERCYSPKQQIKNPTYQGCTVASEWHTFSNFKNWMESQDWQGKELDKDLLAHGNKIYGPDACIFVPQEINLILGNKYTNKNGLPRGVCFDKNRDKFTAQIGIRGKNKGLGRFNSKEEASSAYIIAKSTYLAEIANEQTDERLKAALLRHAALFVG